MLRERLETLVVLKMSILFILDAYVQDHITHLHNIRKTSLVIAVEVTINKLSVPLSENNVSILIKKKKVYCSNLSSEEEEFEATEEITSRAIISTV